MKKYTKATPRVSESAVKFYDLFQTRNQGVEWAVEAMPSLVCTTLARELRGKFTREEIVVILDAMDYRNSPSRINASMAGTRISASVDADCQVSAIRMVVLEKLGGLTIFQRASLEVWANQFWQTDWSESDAAEKYCAILEAAE